MVGMSGARPRPGHAPAGQRNPERSAQHLPAGPFRSGSEFPRGRSRTPPAFVVGRAGRVAPRRLTGCRTVRPPTVCPPLAGDSDSATPFSPATCCPVFPSTRQIPQGPGAAFSGEVLAEGLSRLKGPTGKNALRRHPPPHPPRRILPAPDRRTANPNKKDSKPIVLNRRGFGGVPQPPEGAKGH
jgi:hypothetical protein